MAARKDIPNAERNSNVYAFERDYDSYNAIKATFASRNDNKTNKERIKSRIMDEFY